MCRHNGWCEQRCLSTKPCLHDKKNAHEITQLFYFTNKPLHFAFFFSSFMTSSRVHFKLAISGLRMKLVTNMSRFCILRLFCGTLHNKMSSRSTDWVAPSMVSPRPRAAQPSQQALWRALPGVYGLTRATRKRKITVVDTSMFTLFQRVIRRTYISSVLVSREQCCRPRSLP